MQPLGLQRGLRQRLPCRSIAPTQSLRPLRPLLIHNGSSIIIRRAAGGSTGASDSSPPPPGPDSTSARTAAPLGAASSSPIPPSASLSQAQPEAPTQQPTGVSGAGFAAGPDAAPTMALPSTATPGISATSTAAAPSSPTVAAAGRTSTRTSTSGGTSFSAGAALPLAGSPSSLPPFVQQLLTWLASVWAVVQQFPAWVQTQHLTRLREACEEEPWDADKHAAYLAELVRTNPREVVARVEGRRAAINGAVVAEYLRALVDTGRVAELVKADAATANAAYAAAAAAAADAQGPRTLSELLALLQEQLVAVHAPSFRAGPDSGVADSTAPFSLPDGGAAPGSSSSAFGFGGAAVPSYSATATLGTGGSGAPEAPGWSVRRPLHVVLTGVPPGVLQTSASASPPSATSSSPAPLLLRPLALLWRLTTMALLLLVLAFAYLAGSQAIRRVQASGGFVGHSASAVSPGPPVTAAGGGGGGASTSSSSGGGGGPSVEPKEYKKEELPEKSIRTFKDVKGCDEAKEELREVVEFLKNPTKFTRLGAKLPKGVLLTGPPGTGKTLLAKAVAGEAGVPFFYRAGSEFEELYVGVGSRRMRALFSAAKKRAPCIIFIDEIDAIGGNRKAWENHTRKTLNQLLVEMDGFESTEGIIVMAATNLPESLDPALKRPGRFDRQVAVPLPDIKGRRDILEYYMADKPLGTDVDRELLARQTQGFSGADLSNLINEGAILAAKEGSEAITQRMLDWAYDKILMGVERKSVKRTLEARRRTSYHEAGHALVALAVPGASPIHKATIVPRGHALGMVTQVGREDEFSINRQQMLARIWVCMGGTVAEELVFGSDQVSSGATDDLRQATSMARHMVAECGMSPVIGPVYVAAHEERHGGAGVSEATRKRVDDEVAAILAEAREGVRVLLRERMQDLRTLAEALLDRETLTREEINSLLQTDQQPAPPAGGAGGGGSGGSRDPRVDDDVPLPVPVPAPAAAQVSSPAAAAAAAELTAAAVTASTSYGMAYGSGWEPAAPWTGGDSQDAGAAAASPSPASASPSPSLTWSPFSSSSDPHVRPSFHQTKQPGANTGAAAQQSAGAATAWGGGEGPDDAYGLGSLGLGSSWAGSWEEASAHGWGDRQAEEAGHSGGLGLTLLQPRRRQHRGPGRLRGFETGSESGGQLEEGEGHSSGLRGVEVEEWVQGGWRNFRTAPAGRRQDVR